MRKPLIALALLLCLAITSQVCPLTVAQATDATSAWDTYAASHNFKTSGLCTAQTTVAGSYIGSNYAVDKLAQVYDVSQVAGPPIGDPSDDLPLLGKLSNW